MCMSSFSSRKVQSQRLYLYCSAGMVWSLKPNSSVIPNSYIHWVNSWGDPADLMQGSLQLSEAHPETQHALKEKIPHLPDTAPIDLCAFAEKYLKQADKVAQSSSWTELMLGGERKDGICRQPSWNQWIHDMRPDATLGAAWCLPSQTRWDIIIVLWTVIPFLQLILFSNYKNYLLSTFPESVVLRREGASNHAIRKSVDFPAPGEHDCGLGALFVLTKYKYKNK